MLDRIKKLIYVIYPSGLGGEFLSYIISNSIVNCNRNFANLNPELTGAWQGSCLFHFFADVNGDDNFINRQYVDNFNPDFSKWVVCKDHHRNILYEFLLKNFPDVKIIVLMPDGPEEYFAKLCVHKTSILLDATEENLQKFLSLSYKELISSDPTTKHWDHNTTKQLIDYRPYYKKLREVYFSSEQWWRPELYDLISSILNDGTYLQHDPNLDNLIYHRKQEFIKDIINLQKYIDNFDTLVIPGNCYKESTKQFFIYLASKFNVNPSQQIINEFQSWINVNNEIQEKI